MGDAEKNGLDRREFLMAGLSATALLPAAAALLRAAPARAADEALVTEIEANAPIVQSLQYTHQSEKEGQNCATCQFYTAGSGGTGKCQLIPNGLVKETGWCMSWTQKVS